MAKLLKNKECKERIMEWIRLAVGLNQEKQKMYTQSPVCSDGFIFNLIDVMLLFCKPFTAKFSEFYQTYPKINAFYLINDNYIVNAQKIEKIDNDVVNQFKSSGDYSNVTFTNVTIEPV